MNKTNKITQCPLLKRRKATSNYSQCLFKSGKKTGKQQSSKAVKTLRSSSKLPL